MLICNANTADRGEGEGQLYKASLEFEASQHYINIKQVNSTS